MCYRDDKKEKSWKIGNIINIIYEYISQNNYANILDKHDNKNKNK